MEDKLLRIPTGGRLTSWLFTQRVEELNSGLPTTNPGKDDDEDDDMIRNSRRRFKSKEGETENHEEHATKC